MVETINYNLYTRLPVRVLQKAEQLNNVLEVITPHKGVVFVELKTVDRGIFRQASEVEKNTNYVLEELRTLEREARDYLMEQWLNN